MIERNNGQTNAPDKQELVTAMDSNPTAAGYSSGLRSGTVSQQQVSGLDLDRSTPDVSIAQEMTNLASTVTESETPVDAKARTATQNVTNTIALALSSFSSSFQIIIFILFKPLLNSF